MIRLSGSIFVVVVLFLCYSVPTVSAEAKCSDPKSRLADLLISGTDSPAKIPLILIHGIHGTSDEAPVNADNQNWNEFKRIFAKSESGLSKRYALYLFQYCSDRQPVSEIAATLRDLIDAKLTDRDHVILAHSMGGLVAKSYMTEARHLSGKWKGKNGGDTTLGLITLATPHHGTPGANDLATVDGFIPDAYERVYAAAQNIYWLTKKRNDGAEIMSPNAANRSDLKWDNYDNKLDPASKDINTPLSRTNERFAPYRSKLIAYAGFSHSPLTALEIATLILDTGLANEKALRQHKALTLANIGLVSGLGNHFGEADGLVPFVSGLFCKSSPESATPPPPNYVCTTESRVRRFETGGATGEVPSSQLPNTDTLSIVRSERGFDHLDLLTNEVVLGYVIKDLTTFLPGPPKVQSKQNK